MMLHIILAGLLTTQIASIEQPNKARINKVWTVELKYSACDVELISSKQGNWDIEQQVFKGPLRPAPLHRVLFQWTYKLGEEYNPNFKMMDLLSEMSKTVYYLDVYGKGLNDNTGEVEDFLYRMWISPVGVSNKPIIEMPPIRSSYDRKWTQEEGDKILEWIYGNHFIVSKYLFSQFSVLQKKMDHRLTLDLYIGKDICREGVVIADKQNVIKDVSVLRVN